MMILFVSILYILPYVKVNFGIDNFRFSNSKFDNLQKERSVETNITFQKLELEYLIS